VPTLAEIVERFGGLLVGDGSVSISQVASLEHAGEEEISFLAGLKYRSLLAQTKAGAVIIPPAAEGSTAKPGIVADNPYLYFARLAQWLNPPRQAEAGIHPSAVVLSPIPDSVSVGALAYIGPDCEIAENVVIGPGCIVESGVSVGESTRLYGHVSIYQDCVIGARCILHSGAVIGADGFGYARERDGSWVKIPQIGRAVLGDDVEIGANTTVDRGALGDTIVERGVKLDNLIQIAHNVKVGENSAMAGCVGVAGSAEIGARVMVGGQAGISGHLKIADDTVVSARTLISKTIAKPGVVTSAMPGMPHDDWMKNVAHFRHLDLLVARLRELEKRVVDLEKEA